jgi:hypothetical protein
MVRRLVLVFFAVCLAATAATLTVDQLFSFIQSSIEQIKEGRQTDKETADFLATKELSERLDDRSVEQMESLGIGPRTLAALRKLRDQSQTLPASKPIEPPAPPPLRPPPTSGEQAAAIDAMRTYALDYSRNLPNFICSQVMRRYYAPPPGPRSSGPADGEPPWRKSDELLIRLSFFEQKEEYRPMLVNGAMTNKDYKSLGGTLVSGDFGSMLKEIFEPETQTRFEWGHWGTLRGKEWLMAFAYHVDQARSQWHITYDKLDIVPAYHGLIYMDPHSHEIARVTLEAENIPAGFPVHWVQTTLDYDYADISGRKFLLPMKDATLSGVDDYLSRLDTEFRSYHEYSAESELKFDTDTPEPLPADKTRETPVTTSPPPPETPATQPPPPRGKKN